MCYAVITHLCLVKPLRKSLTNVLSVMLCICIFATIFVWHCQTVFKKVLAFPVDFTIEKIMLQSESPRVFNLSIENYLKFQENK